MAAPKAKPVLNLPKPVYTGSTPGGPSNADRLRKVIGQRKQTEKSKGIEYEVPTAGILRTLANGNDADRMLLREIWDSLDDRGRQIVKQSLIAEMPSAQNPRGIDAEGKQVYSSEAQKIIDVAEGRGISPEARAAIEKSDPGRVPKKATESGPTQYTEEEGHSGSYTQEDGAETTSADREGALTKEAAEDPQNPRGLRRLPKPDGLDPKKAGVHDPGSGQSDIRDRQHFRVDYSYKTDENGNIIREVDPKESSYAREDMGALRAGEAYEESMKKRDEIRVQLLLAHAGSMENAAALLRRAQDGDPEARAIMSGIRTLVDKEVPRPKKPRPIEDFQAGSTEATPIDQFERYGMDLIMGAQTSPIYTPKRGKFDTAMAAWKALQSKVGRGALVPNIVFSSPRQMAEQYVRNMRPELFDYSPVTASQRADAGDTVRAFSPTTPDSARSYIDAFGDAPTNPASKEVFRNQAIDRLERVFADRFGGDWSGDYKPDVGRWVEGEDGYTRQSLSKEQVKELPEGPDSTEPALPEGTSMDPASIPREGVRDWRALGRGAENKAGTKAAIDSDEVWDEYQRTSDALMKATRNDKAFKEYLDSNEYIATPDRPKAPSDWLVSDEGKIPDSVQKKYDEVMSSEEGLKEPGRSWNELSAEEQHDQTYRNYEKGKPQKSSSYKENFVEHNQRYPMTPQDRLEYRDRKVGELSEFFPQLQGAGRTSEIIKQIDGLQAQIDNYPEEVLKLEEELQSPGLTPSRAKEIRSQLKPMYEAHEASIGGLQSQVDELKKRLVMARRADEMTGVQSARKAPLGGKVSGRKGKADAAPEAPVKADTNPADTEPVTAPTEVVTESDTPVIEGRPDPAPAPEAAATPDPVPEAAPSPSPSPAPEAAPATPDSLGMDDYLDDLDSAHAIDMGDEAFVDDIMASPDPDAPTAPDEMATADSAARVDEAEAPRDIEAERPAEEASTIPEGTGSEATPDDTPAVRDKTKPAPAGKFPTKTAATIGAAGSLAALFGLSSVGSRVAQQSAYGQGGNGDGMPMPGQGGEGGLGAGGAAMPPMPVSGENTYGYATTDPAERIRMMQKIRGYVPKGIPQTAQQWR